MIERIILSIVAIVMLILTIQRKERLSIVLTSGLTLGILIIWFGNLMLIRVGMLTYLISALWIMLYGLKKKELLTYEKLIISLTGLFAVIANLFELMHYPYAYEIGLSMIIPLVLFLFALVRGLIRKCKLGFMVILNLEFLFRFINLWS